MAVFRKFLTKKLSKTVEAVVEPAKETVKATVEAVKEGAGNRVDLYSKIVILAVELFVGYKLISDHGEEHRAAENRGAMPGTIIINNYIDRKEQKTDEHQ